MIYILKVTEDQVTDLGFEPLGVTMLKYKFFGLKQLAKRAKKIQFIHWGILSTTWWACCRQANYIAHMSTYIDICQSSLMSDIERIFQYCQHNMSRYAYQTLHQTLGRHKNDSYQTIEGPRMTFTCIFSGLRVILRPP